MEEIITSWDITSGDITSEEAIIMNNIITEIGDLIIKENT